MKYYIGNVTLDYDLDFEHSNLEKFKINKYSDEKNVVSFKVNIEDNLPKPVGNHIYKEKYLFDEDKFEITSTYGRETRAFYQKDNLYAFLEEVDNNQYNLKIKRENYIHDGWQILNHSALESILIKFSAFILHSSFIKHNDKGILFTAPSGTGKSTQANLWNKFKKAKIINGDRSLIQKYKDKWCGFGIPFSGSSEYCEHDMAELKAIIVLKQSPVNKIEKLDKSTAIKKLISETTINYWNSSFVNKVVDLINDLVEDVPVYEFACTKEEDAVEFLDSILWGDDNE